MKDSTESAYFLGVNRNKRSITIDFKKPEGQKLIHELAMKCDVIVENFKVGGLKPYNLDYDFIKGINKRIIYCSITGYGQTGPRKDQPGYDFAIQGAGGLMSITGEKDGDPMKVGVAVVDVMTGMYAVSGILSALIYREKTGIGQHIDVSLFDTQLAFLANQGMNYLISGKSPSRLGNQHPNIVPYSSIETKDGHIIIAVGNDKQYKNLCIALDREDLIDNPLYKTNPLRTQNRDLLYEILRKEFKKQPKQYWIDKLTNFGVPNSPVNSIEEAFLDPQAIHRESKITMKHPYNDEVPLLGNPLKLSESKIEYRLPPPLLGQHTEEILKEFLGKTDEEIEQYKKLNVI